MIRSRYSANDFDFALIYIDNEDVFYVFPCDVFLGYGSVISLVEAGKRQRKPKSAIYRCAWGLIAQWASQKEIFVRTSHKFGETSSVVIPSEALLIKRERVET